jgi:heat-inducible transcriptional repressor
MLSDRRQRILSALIEEYVAHAMPVGSRTIAEQYHLGVSSATIRNELAALEEAGYIVQPHTSAGRIPTDAGYRAFVDDLLAANATRAASMPKAVASLRASAAALDDLMDKMSNELARLTKCMSIVVPPASSTVDIRQVSFITLSEFQILTVVVLVDGNVLNSQIDLGAQVDLGQLASIQNTSTQLFTGKSVMDAINICEAIISDAGMVAQSPFSTPLGQSLAEGLIKCLHMSRPLKAGSAGMSTLMNYPEFHDSASLLPILEILEDDTVLFKTVNESNSVGDVTVRIGRENSTEQLSGVSVIAGSYGRGNGRGIVAVIGPTRMDYSRVINAVRLAQSVLKQE